MAPLDEHIALARASAPLTDWADWPQTQRNIAASHGTPLPAGRTHTTAASLSGIIHSQFQDFRREQINLLRAVNPAFPELLEGAAPPDAPANTAYRNFQHKMFGYLCVVMKYPTAAMALSNFQRDPSFSTRVSPGSDAWRALVDLFDQRGIGRTVNLLTKLMEPQGDKENIDAYLQRMLHCYQDINEDEQMVDEKLLVAATLQNLNSKLSSARASIIAALYARQDGQASTSVPFTQLCTMLIRRIIGYQCPYTYSYILMCALDIFI
jgi:hypothetical protein